MGRKVFSAITVILLLVTGWMAWANVLSDDTALKLKAGAVAREKAGCGDKCKTINMQGDRGMISTTVEYHFENVGRFLVTCKRPQIAFGDHVCEATKL